MICQDMFMTIWDKEYCASSDSYDGQTLGAIALAEVKRIVLPRFVLINIFRG